MFLAQKKIAAASLPEEADAIFQRGGFERSYSLTGTRRTIAQASPKNTIVDPKRERIAMKGFGTGSEKPNAAIKILPSVRKITPFKKTKSKIGKP